MTDFKEPETRQGLDTPDDLAPDGWIPRDSSSENFSYTAREDGVTVNGKRYASLDDVPAQDRARIEALQAQFGPESELMKSMLASGKSKIKRSSTWVWSTKKGTKTTTRTRETTMEDEDALAPSARVHQPGEVPAGFTTSVPHADASPGAVPRTGGMPRLAQFVMLVIVVAAVWLGGQALRLF